MGFFQNVKDKLTEGVDKYISKDIQDIPPEIGSFNPPEPGQESPQNEESEKFEEFEEQEEKEIKKKTKNHEKAFPKNILKKINKPVEFQTYSEEARNKVVYDELLLKIEKINAVLDSFEAFKKFNSERIGQVSEQIGELRSNIINVERDVKGTETKATLASDLVKEVQPEKLMTNLQKEDAKLEVLKARIEGLEGYNKSLLSELKEIKSKMSVFRGSEEILKLQDSVKRDLVDIQKVKTIVEGHADKVEEIFINIKNDVTSFEKLNLIIKDLSGSFKDVKKNIEELKIKSEIYAPKDELTKLKDSVSSQILTFDKYLSGIKNEIGDLNKIDSLAVKLTSIIKTNSDELNNLKEKLTSKTIEYDTLIKKISQNEIKIDNLLNIADLLSTKVKTIEDEKTTEITNLTNSFNDFKSSLDDLKEKSEHYMSKEQFEELNEPISKLNDANETKLINAENSLEELKNSLQELKQNYSTKDELTKINEEQNTKLNEFTVKLTNLLNISDLLSNKAKYLEDKRNEDQVNLTNSLTDLKNNFEELKIKSEIYANKEELNKLKDDQNLKSSEIENNLNSIRRHLKELRIKSENYALKDEIKTLKEAFSSSILESEYYVSKLKGKIEELNKLHDSLSTQSFKKEKEEMTKKLNANTMKLNHLISVVDKLSNKVKPRNPEDKNVIMLSNYIKSAVDQGFSLNEIKSKALQSHWPVEIFLKAEELYESNAENE